MSKENCTTQLKSLLVNFHDYSDKIHKVVASFSTEEGESRDRPLKIQFIENGKWLKSPTSQENFMRMQPVIAYEVSADVADLEHLIRCLTEACEMWRETWGKKPDDVT